MAGRPILQPGSIPAWAGKRPDITGQELADRSIPAWAGETQCWPDYGLADRVYPRVGGGNRPVKPGEMRRLGLSPRGRGKLPEGLAKQVPLRSIPAWAGETGAADRRWRGPMVYPRVGGGNCPVLAPAAARGGLSPRGRGKPAVPPAARHRGGSIPAWAGETGSHRSRWSACRVYPRVGGGNRPRNPHTTNSRGLSPRGRGKLLPAQGQRYRPRSIPPWAGETRKP